MIVRPALESRSVAALLVGLVCFGSMSVDLYLPSMPAIAAALHADPSAVQLTLGAFTFGFGTAQLVHGPLSDRFGRRPVLLCGIVLYLVASILCTLADRIELLIAARFLQAFGGCAGPVLGRAIVRDVYPPDQAARMLSLLMVAFTLSPLAAPIAGGYLQVWFGWQSGFVLMAGFAVTMFVLVLLFLSESNRHPDLLAGSPLRMVQVFGMLLTHRGFRANLMMQGCMMGAVFAFLSASSFLYVGPLGGEAEHFGFFFAVPIVGVLIGNLCTANLVRRLGSPRLIRVGILVGLVGTLAGFGLALAQVQTFAAVAVPMAVMMVGNGLVVPNNTAEALIPFPRAAGSASALLGCAQVAFGLPVGWLVVALGTGSTLPLEALMFGLWLWAAAANLAAAPRPAAAIQGEG